MPPVKSPHRHTVVIVVKIMDFLIMTGIVGISHIWRTIILLYCFSVYLLCKAPGTAEIVFCSCTADRGIFFISINIKFDLPFSPPVSFQSRKGHISSHIMSFSFYLIQYHIVLLQLGDLLSSPLCVKICDV